MQKKVSSLYHILFNFDIWYIYDVESSTINMYIFKSNFVCLQNNIVFRKIYIYKNFVYQAIIIQYGKLAYNHTKVDFFLLKAGRCQMSSTIVSRKQTFYYLLQQRDIYTKQYFDAMDMYFYNTEVPGTMQYFVSISW